MKEKYDSTDPKSIEEYAQQLIGKTFNDICLENPYIAEPSISNGYYASDNSGKGQLGQIIEERFFNYKCNNDAEADFREAGVELKVSPYRVNKNNTISAKERLTLTMINYLTVVNESFEESHLWNKCKLLLIIYYLYQKELASKFDYQIHFAKLFTPPEQDLKIIKHDYELIVEKVKSGKAHELSEGDTLYLGAAPKGQNSSDRRRQPYSDIQAKPRAFVYKQGYMSYVLNNYIAKNVDTYESIVHADVSDDFETYITKKIAQYQGWTVTNLCTEFGIQLSKHPKNLGAIIAYKILGIKGNKAAEFEKAKIALKTIRVKHDGGIKENMSFPTFKFKELIMEEWEDSTFGNYLRETRFLFVVFKYNANNELVLQGCQFWNISYNDLEQNVRPVWEKTKSLLIDGFDFKKENGKYINNFPKQSESKVCHVRPHAKNSFDVYELPDGRKYPKQCFWLNNTYIYSQLKDSLK